MDYDDDEVLSDAMSIASNDDNNPPKATITKDDNETSNEYIILDLDQLLVELNNLASETASVIRFSSGICKILLHQFRWNKEMAVERFYDAGDPDAFLRDCHVVEPKISTGLDSEHFGTCQICFNETNLTGLSCGHVYCGDCWKNYLTIKIVNEGIWMVPCPGLKCFVVLDEDAIRLLVNVDTVISAYQKLLVHSFVQSNSRLQWCPGANCGKVAKVQHPEKRPITCKCGVVFCFSCNREWHEPVSCEMLKKWLKKCSDDSETSNWLSANTKDCPKCHVTIEKDGGCNHMTCKSSACRFEFCWTCLGPWQPHGSGWYSCNRFDDSEAKKARDDQEKSRAALQRYLHYYNRFMNHQNSLKLENKLYALVKEKMKQMQQQDFSWIETQFLRNAVDVLSECRRTLMYTYAFAFYLQQNNMTIIFENNQRDLEFATEQLSEFLEKDLDVNIDSLRKLKQAVQDKCRYVEQRRVVLLSHVAEGIEANQWEYNIRF